MANHITGLDHAVVAVHDLDAAAATFERLGFTVTPTSTHAEWGTANRCVMFGPDYIELIAGVGAGAPADRVRAFTATREGLMAMAIGSRDAEADAARLGVHAETLSRLAGDLPARFRVAVLPPEAAPGMPCWLCQHLTPEALRQPGWTEHGNGALRLLSVTASMARPAAAVPAWERLFGLASVNLTDELATVHTGHGLAFLATADDLEQLHPAIAEEPLPPQPALVALAVKVASTDAAARLLARNGVGFDRDGGGTIAIPASEAHGVYLELAE